MVTKSVTRRWSFEHIRQLADMLRRRQATALSELATDLAVSRRISPASQSFDPLRGDPRFQAILAEAEVGRWHALAAFHQAGGERLLGW